MFPISPFLFALYYTVPFALLLIAGSLALQSLQTGQRVFLAKIAFCTFVLAALYALAIHQNPWAADTLFYHKDDSSYDRWGWEISQAWRQGSFPRLASEALIGSLHTGYYRFIAAIYLIVGHQVLAVLALNLLACALIPIGLFFLGKEFGAESASRAALLGAFYPTFWFHSSFILRDVWITLFFLAALVSLLRLLKAQKRPAALFCAFCLCAFLAELFILRFYVALIILAGWVIYELALGTRRRQSLRATSILLFLLALMRLHPTTAHLQDRMFQSFTWSIPRTLNTFPAIFERLGEGSFKLFLSPFAWATEGGYTVDYFLWPGQWVVYLIILPLGIWGMVSAIRSNKHIAFLLIFPMAVSAYGFAIAYGGSVPRQRMFLDAVLIIFAAMAGAEHRPPRRYLGWYYGLFLCFILTHVISLFVRGIW